MGLEERGNGALIGTERPTEGLHFEHIIKAGNANDTKLK